MRLALYISLYYIVINMAKECPLCGKGTIMGGKRNLLRGKYNPTPKKRKYPNLQWVRIPVSENRNEKGMPKGQRIKICTRCLKKNLHLKQKVS